MKPNRIKRSLNTIPTRDEAENLLTEITLATINKQKLVAKKNEVIASVDAFHNPGIALCDCVITENSAKLQSWAEANPTEFGKLKSITWPSGKFGFRTGTPKLELLSRKWTWKKVLTCVLVTCKKRAKEWVRTKQEINKDTILAECAKDPKIAASIQVLGMKVTQDETFFIEPAIETVQPRTTSTSPVESSKFNVGCSKFAPALVLLCSLCYLLFNSSSEAAQIELQRPVNGIATVIVRQLQFFPYYTHFASLQTSTNLIVWSAPAPTWRDGDTLYYTFTNRPAVYCRLQVSQVNYNWSR